MNVIYQNGWKMIDKVLIHAENIQYFSNTNPKSQKLLYYLSKCISMNLNKFSALGCWIQLSNYDNMCHNLMSNCNLNVICVTNEHHILYIEINEIRKFISHMCHELCVRKMVFSWSVRMLTYIAN
jgi:hypothetical protein